MFGGCSGAAGIGISLLGIYVDAKIADVDGTKAQKIKEAEERKDEQRRQKMDKA